jgi:hypothetical protein
MLQSLSPQPPPYYNGNKTKRNVRSSKYYSNMNVFFNICILIMVCVFIDCFCHTLGELNDPENLVMYENAIKIESTQVCKNSVSEDCKKWRSWYGRNFYLSLISHGIDDTWKHGLLVSTFLEYVVQCDAACRLHYNMGVNAVVTNLWAIIIGGMICAVLLCFYLVKTVNNEGYKKAVKMEAEALKEKHRLLKNQLKRTSEYTDILTKANDNNNNNNHNSLEAMTYKENGPRVRKQMIEYVDDERASRV